MKPYYDEDGIVIYHGDCRDLESVWDVAGAVMVTDPPYGMAFTTGGRKGWQSRWTGVDIEGDADTSARDHVLHVWNGRPALVFGTWKAALPDGVREVLVWDKVVSTGMGALDIPWRPSWEAVFVIGSGWVGPRGHGVLRVPLPTLAEDRHFHPTVKPLPLMLALIAKCPPLATVVDPFCGSGTTLVAAKALGRGAVGVEVNERYCEIAARRLAQGVLFGVGQ